MMEELKQDEGKKRKELLALVMGIAAASLLFRLATGIGMQHTSLVFMGVPAVLAVAVGVSPRPGTARGTIIRATTLALLLAGVALGEAFVCLLMASPLIYLVAILLGVFVDWSDRQAERRWGRRGFAHAPLLALTAMAIPAMEGVVPRFEFPREAEVTATRIVPAAPAEVERALAAPMRFDRPLPRFLRLGFPVPGATEGSGLRVGDRRAVELRHGHHPGTLAMEVRASAPGRVLFAPVGDDSYVVHWLSWRSAEVRWRAVPGGTEVRWTLRYRRRLDPAWYFAPLERYGVGVAAGYLVDALATPRTGDADKRPSHAEAQSHGENGRELRLHLPLARRRADGGGGWGRRADRAPVRAPAAAGGRRVGR
ncbi:MAG: hypothetical protein ACJ8J0_10135 [Longimicrobiaceae bacterium]